MDTTQLRIFVEVAQQGSFAAVARQRGVAPSSISRAVSALEEALGVLLLQRTTRQMTLTDAGAVYAEQVRPLLEALDEAAAQAQDTAARPQGTLRITAPVTFSQVSLVPLLPAFAARHPELSFDLLITDRIVDLVEARVDVAVRLGRLPDTGLIATRLCDMVYVACASPAYLDAHGHPAAPEALRAHECLRYPVPGQPARWRFRASADAPILEVPVSGRVMSTDGVALRDCAVAGMGVVMLPRWNVARELASGALVDVFPDWQVTASAFDIAAWALYPSRQYLPLRVRAFVDYLKAMFHG